MDLPKRKHPRLKDYDYSQNGVYYITICVEKHQCILGHIDENKKMRLSGYGEVARNYIQEIDAQEIDAHYQFVHVVNYIVMPNHVHLLIQKEIPPTVIAEKQGNDNLKTASIDVIVRAFKRMTTREIGHSIWQGSFYDHVIRSYADIQRVSDYIDANPRRWRTEKHKQRRAGSARPTQCKL